MARIKTYEIDNLISGKDIVIGSDADDVSKTKNYKVDNLRNYMLSGLSPEIGGNLKITTIVDNESIYETPQDYFNNSNPPIEILNYEIVFLILNGRTYIFRKTNGLYGVGGEETFQSDFTEIDVSSVINAGLQDLDQVLEKGNSSDLDILLKDVFLKNLDSGTGLGYIKIDGNKNRLNITNNQGNLNTSIDKNSLVFHRAGASSSMTLLIPSVSSNRTATFQNSSGTVAYLSDIPSISVFNILPGDNVSVSNSGGVFTISSSYKNRPYVISTELRNNNTNTTFFLNGGLFSFDELINNINSVKVLFSSNIQSIVGNASSFGSIYLKYTSGRTDMIDMNVGNCTISANSIEYSFNNFINTYKPNLTEDLVDLEVSLFPNLIKQVDGLNFDGNISTSLSRYYANVSIDNGGGGSGEDLFSIQLFYTSNESLACVSNTSGTFYINTPSFATATLIYSDVNGQTFAPNYYYRFNDLTYRSSTNGVLSNSISCEVEPQVCYEYEATTVMSPGTVNYTDCDGQLQSVPISAGLSIQFCALEGTISVEGNDITYEMIGDCPDSNNLIPGLISATSFPSLIEDPCSLILSEPIYIQGPGIQRIFTDSSGTVGFNGGNNYWRISSAGTDTYSVRIDSQGYLTSELSICPS
jgi:hypothetical protein